MDTSAHRSQRLDFPGAFNQAWIQYRANFGRIFPFGLLAALPPFAFLYSIPVGLTAMFGIQGYFFMLLAEATHRVSIEESPRMLPLAVTRFFFHFRNGFGIMVFALPLIFVGFGAVIAAPILALPVVAGTVAAFTVGVILSLLFFSFFLFSFHQSAVNGRFSIDACMESYRNGKRFRGSLLIFSLLIYLTALLIYIAASLLGEGFLWTAIAPSAFVLPYFFLVLEELNEQVEKK